MAVIHILIVSNNNKATKRKVLTLGLYDPSSPDTQIKGKKKKTKEFNRLTSRNSFRSSHHDLSLSSSRNLSTLSSSHDAIFILRGDCNKLD